MALVDILTVGRHAARTCGGGETADLSDGADAIPGIELISELGHGAGTVTYRGSRDGTDYAVTVLSADVDTDDAEAFLRKAAVLSTVDHPGLARIHEVGHVSGSLYVITDIVDGRSLAQVLSAGPLEEIPAVRIARQIADVVIAIHAIGLTCHTISPQTIMITDLGNACLANCGPTVHADADTSMSTLAYHAPERRGLSHRPTDGRCDLYSLGVLLYECLTGSVPIDTDSGEPYQGQVILPPPDIRAIIPDITSATSAVIAKLLAQDPDLRYSSARGLVADMDRIIAGQRDNFPLGTEDIFDPRSDLDLIGRHEELAELTGVWREATVGRGRLVLVGGPAGIGKSRLVRELTHLARKSHYLTFYGRCVPHDPPLTPFRSAIETYLGSLDRLPETERESALDRLRNLAAGSEILLRVLSPELAIALDAPSGDIDDSQGQIAIAVATLLVGLAADGAVFHLDDGHWSDEASLLVLRQLAVLAESSRLLIVITCRENLDKTLDNNKLDAVIGTRLVLGPVDNHTTVALAAKSLTTANLPDEWVAQLTAKTQGNPLAVLTYISEAVDTAVLRPSWGRWVLDKADADTPSLPGDAAGLILRRSARLSPHTRHLVEIAAVMGARFSVALAARVGQTDGPTAAKAFTEALDRQLIELSPDGRYAFTHTCVHEAVLSELDETRMRQIHQRIAEEMESGYSRWDEVFALADHYLRGEPERTPQQAVHAAFSAAIVALHLHAPADALHILAQADAVATTAKIPLSSHFNEIYGVAASRIGYYQMADSHFTSALEEDDDSLRRASICAAWAESYRQRFDGVRTVELVLRGLAELGRPLPQHPGLLLLSTMGLFVVGLVVGCLPSSLRMARGATRERYRIQTRLGCVGSIGASLMRDNRMRGMLMLRLVTQANRLGAGHEYVVSRCGMAMAAHLARWGWMSRRMLTQADTIALGLGDPRTVAHVHWTRAMMRDLYGRPGHREENTGYHLSQVLESHGHWLDVGDYLCGVSILAMMRAVRGYTDEASEWLRRGVARSPNKQQLGSSPVVIASAVVAALAGKSAEAIAWFRDIREYLTTEVGDQSTDVVAASCAVWLAVERGDLGSAFDHALEELAVVTEKYPLWWFEKLVWVEEVFARLALVYSASPHQRAKRLADAEHTVSTFGKKADEPLLRAYHQAAQAALAHLHGDPTRALRQLAILESWADRLDVPLLNYEMERIRARAYQTLNLPDNTQRHAAIALLLATKYGWAIRAHWVRDEFGLDESVSEKSSHCSSISGSPDIYRRRLEALHRVSIVAATVLDPKTLVRVALDEIVSIFAADRALLFLSETLSDIRSDIRDGPPEGDDVGQCVPYLGRDSTGAELGRLTGYGRTLIDQVRESREAIVVTGGEEQTTVGFHSAMTYGLRSIIVAPLLLKGRMLGVIYLDTRLIRGVFTSDDVDILVAIANHVALALETARAAQLTLAVQTAQRERDLASTLRGVLANLTSSLDPAEVAGRLTAAVGDVLSSEAAVLLKYDSAGGITVAAHYSAASSDVSVVGLLGDTTTSWMAVPIQVMDSFRGLLVAASSQPYTDAQAQIAITLAEQGVVAMSNALLFQRVEELAAYDSLTGLFNRRHFVHLADAHLVDNDAVNQPIAAIMIDIDHFKDINDSYGHGVGDEVIQDVAQRLAVNLRDSDVICRFGGEEFAILLPNTPVEQAHLVAARLLSAISEVPVPSSAGPLPVTVSIGLALSSVTADSGHLQDLINQADEALYEAKRSGRNRVVSSV